MLRTQFIQTFGSEANFDHILFCLPEGTISEGKNWIAYAYRYTKFSFFNDDWCGSITSKMHEVGHNFGNGHSGEGEEGPYEDRTCVMGVSLRDQHLPQECHNGLRHWTLGWFSKHHVTDDPIGEGSWRGNLVAFVDYSNITDGDHAIINVGDLYIQCNLADKHNIGVQEKANTVTIVKSGGSPEAVSTMLAGLDMENSVFEYEYNGNFIVIEVCEEVNYGGNVRYFRLSTYERSQQSVCNGEILGPIDSLKLRNQQVASP